MTQLASNLTSPVKFSPHSQAIAYRVWAYASPRGWDCTAAETARATGIPLRSVNRVATLKGWGGRFRSTNGSPLDESHMPGHAESVRETILAARAAARLPCPGNGYL